MRSLGSSKPRNYLARNFQVRLLMLVMLLGLVMMLMLMVEARKPTTWSWLWRANPDMSGTSTAETWASESPRHRTYLPGIDPADVEQIRDNSVFLASESDIWDRWIRTLNQASHEQLEDASMGTVGELQLLAQMDQYRGQVVTVKGRVRRAHFVREGPQDNQTEGYWQCWLFPGRAGRSPLVVYALAMPEGFPRGMNIDEVVSFTALPYKRWAYQAKGGPAVAPLLLAKRGDWMRPAVPQVSRRPNHWMLAAACGIATTIALCVTWSVWRQTRRPPGTNEKYINQVKSEFRLE